MIRLLIFCVLFVPLWVSASTFVEQASPFDIATWRDLETGASYYGQIDGFPHTFQFVITEPQTVELQLMAPKGGEPVSLILVREIDRGVEEVVRQSAGRTEFISYRDQTYGLSFNAYDTLALELIDGIYRLEVSAPSNDAVYRLNVAGGSEAAGYFATLRDVIRVHSFFGSSVTAVFSPLVYWPLFILFAGIAVVLFVRRSRHA
jgi:hypothetical protein